MCNRGQKHNLANRALWKDTVDPVTVREKCISWLQTPRKCDDMSSLEWHGSSSFLHRFLWYAVFKCVLWSEGHERCKVMQWNLWGGCIYGKTPHWLARKKKYIYSVILCSHCSVNTSWHSYGSVSKHVIIRIVVMPPTIYYNCNNKSLIWSEQ